MTAFVGLLRAVNVGGTGKLPMERLRAMADEAGFRNARTYIASGNLLFRDDRGEDAVRAALEEQLHAYAGKPVGVVLRSAAELAEVTARNPFGDRPGNRVVAILGDDPVPDDPLAGVRHLVDERVAAGPRCLYVAYTDGMRDSKLVVPFGRTGTGRNMNTVAKLAALAAG